MTLTLKKAVASDGAELAWAEEGQGEPLLQVAGQAMGMSGWAPALIIHGSEDALVPVANAVMMAERISDSQLIQVDGGRHGLHLDDTRVQTWIEDFLPLALPAGVY